MPFLASPAGLISASRGEDKLPKTIEALRSLEIEVLAPSHCTSFAAAAALAAEYPDRFVSNSVGTEIVL